MLGTDGGMEALSLADAGTPFWVLKDIGGALGRGGLQVIAVPTPRGQLAGSRWKRMARRASGGVGSMTSPALVGECD